MIKCTNPKSKPASLLEILNKTNLVVNMFLWLANRDFSRKRNCVNNKLYRAPRIKWKRYALLQMTEEPSATYLPNYFLFQAVKICTYDIYYEGCIFAFPQCTDGLFVCACQRQSVFQCLFIKRFLKLFYLPKVQTGALRLHRLVRSNLLGTVTLCLYGWDHWYSTSGTYVFS